MQNEFKDVTGETHIDRDILSKNLHKLKYFIYFFMQKLRFIAESFSKENFFFSSSIKLKYEVTKTSAIHIT